MFKRTQKKLKWSAVAALLILTGCLVRDFRWSPIRPPRHIRPIEEILTTTGYCPCGECCGWRRNWYGRPVIASGPDRGKAKKVGYTASGTRAKPGTIAADTSRYPFGTVMYVPGYGYGRVEDRGSNIKGMHIDLFFRSHHTAKDWGRQRKTVRIWMPPASRTAR